MKQLQDIRNNYTVDNIVERINMFNDFIKENTNDIECKKEDIIETFKNIFDEFFII